MAVQYPVVSQSRGVELAAEFIDSGPRPLRDDEWSWSGSGPRLDIAPIEEAATAVSAQLQLFDDSDKDLFEGSVTPLVHGALSQVETLALDDPGFWRYLTLAHFWDFVSWREAGAFETGVPGNYLVYTDGTKYAECVVRRTFLRGETLGGDQGYGLAALPNATDFWRSHVLRVSVGSSPPLTRAFAQAHADDRIPWSELRPMARRLNRAVTNRVLPLLTPRQADDMVAQARYGEPIPIHRGSS